MGPNLNLSALLNSAHLCRCGVPFEFVGPRFRVTTAVGYKPGTAVDVDVEPPLGAYGKPHPGPVRQPVRTRDPPLVVASDEERDVHDPVGLCL
ncbi:uncharacterized protein PHACADRAFT_257031, partial [Phanerochaete carnosa HHB-10118-sp]